MSGNLFAHNLCKSMKIVRILVLISILFLSFNRCQKNTLVEDGAQPVEDLSIDQAKAFVEMQKPDQFTLKSGSTLKQKINIRADWSKAKRSNNNLVSVVETQIEAQGLIGFITKDAQEDCKEQGNVANKWSMSRLVVLKEKKTGETYSFIMSIAADSEYAHKKNFNYLSNTYLKRDDDFSGSILFHSITGEFVNGWIYCDGQITHSITDPDNADLSIQLKVATDRAVYVYYQYCTDHYSVGSVDGNEEPRHFTHSSCTGEWIYVGSYSTSSSGDIDNIYGGTTGGYSPSPPATPPCDCANTCEICGKCMDNVIMKSASLPNSGGTNTASGCEICPGHPVPVPIVDANSLKKNIKADCIYNKLLQGGILSNFISRYFGLTEPYHSFLGELNLTWTLGSSTETLPVGVPRNGVYNSVEIRLDETAINSNSATNVALSMLHEALHAKLIAEYYDSAGTTDFKRLYASYKGWGLGNLDSQQEMEMLTGYSEEMAKALFAFDQAQGINHPLTFYMEAIKYTFAEEIGLSKYLAGQDEYSILYYSNINCNE